MTADRQLPDGWRWARFGNVVHQVKQTTKDPESDGFTRIVGLDHLDSESLPLRRWDEISNLPDGTSFTRIFRAGQVLFGKRRAYQRKVAVPDFDGVCSGDILVFEPSTDQLLPGFLPYIVQSEGFFDHALGTSAGSLSPRTKWQELAKYEFRLPPLVHQQEILELLETFDRHLDALERGVIAAHEVYLSLGDSMSSSSDATEALGDVLLTLIDHRGKTPKKLGSDFQSTGVPVVSAAAIKDGRLEMEGVRYVEEGIWKRWMSTPTRKGDILMTSEAPLGSTALVENDAPLVLGQRLFGLRADESRIAGPCLRAFLDSHLGQRQLAQGSSGTTVTGIRASSLVKVQVPLPSASKQSQLAGQIESCLATEQRLKNAADDARVANRTLREHTLRGRHV